ncbi:unnamed protein product, partial [Iphiclides podalirius]
MLRSAASGGTVGLPPPPHARLSLFDSCHRKIRLIGGGPVAFLGGLVAGSAAPLALEFIGSYIDRPQLARTRLERTARGTANCGANKSSSEMEHCTARNGTANKRVGGTTRALRCDWNSAAISNCKAKRGPQSCYCGSRPT